MSIERYDWLGTVKAQRPISPPDGPVLVYDETRCVRASFEQDETLLSYFKDGEYKVYVRAGLRADGTLDLKHRVDDEPW